MIGYKATENGKCLNQLYEVGQTYTLDGKPIMCEKGFHFCQDLFDVFDYYTPNKDIKVFKVEALGDTINSESKSVTNKIKILEEVDLNNLIVEKYNEKRYFDNKGNFVKKEFPCGYWEKYEYDKNGNRIKYENTDEHWEKYEYNENNKLVKTKYSDDSWNKYYYDENNKCIKIENSDGYCVEG
ncbi:hypothetical protein M0P65_05555 [Candidatus Gracilibacteria bacterium]|nr:hypothetical protein [Candidatus Gracilibacteria bacterium]